MAKSMKKKRVLIGVDYTEVVKAPPITQDKPTLPVSGMEIIMAKLDQIQPALENLDNVRQQIATWSKLVNEFKALIVEFKDRLTYVHDRVNDCALKAEKEREESQRAANEKVVIIHGVSEKSGETNGDIKNHLMEICTAMKMDLIDYDHVTRIGQAQKGKIRPIKLTLLRKMDKFQIFANKKLLRSHPKLTNIYIDPARTEQERNLLQKLVGKAKEMKQKIRGLIVHIRNSTLQTTLNGLITTYTLDEKGALKKLPKTTTRTHTY
jgi:hypothetical protein